MDLKPISRVILQAADGSVFYSVPWDATADLTLKAGSGQATVLHGSASYVFAPSDPGATFARPTPAVVGSPAAPGSQDAVTMAKSSPYPTLAAALLAIKPGGTVMVADGDYVLEECSAVVGVSATVKAANPGRVTFDGRQFSIISVDLER